MPVAGGLVTVIETGWRKYLDEKILRRNRTTRANIVNDYHHELMPEHVPGAQPTRAPRSDKPFYLVEDLTLRVKYLKGMTPTNIATGVQVAVAEQLELDVSVLEDPEQLVIDGLEEEPTPIPAPPYITVGYVLDEAEAEVEGVFAVMHDANKMCWAIDLRDLAAETATPPVALPSAPTGPAEPALPTVATAGVESDDAAKVPPLPVVAEAVPDARPADEQGEHAKSS